MKRKGMIYANIQKVGKDSNIINGKIILYYDFTCMDFTDEEAEKLVKEEMAWEVKKHYFREEQK